MARLRVLIVDDHPVVRTGLAGMLGAEDDLEVVGEAGDGEEAVAVARRLRPDVVLMDLRMPHLDGAGATALIVADRPATKVLILTTYDTDTDIVRAVEAGAIGYLLKDAPRTELAAAVGRGGPRRDGSRSARRGPTGPSPAHPARRTADPA